jgi:beta-xylosidase
MLLNYLSSVALAGALLIGSAVGCATAAEADKQTISLFTSFRGNGDGLHLAWSQDARNWTDLGNVFLKPAVGSKLMRDPHILRGPDGLFHMVWTSGWSDKGVGNGNTLAITRAEQGMLSPDMDRPAPPPVLPGVNADPHIAVFGDTFFIYPTTDGSEGWRSTSFQAWSSRDLVSWKNEGVILDLPRDLKWATLHAWAPAIATKNGKYYYYYSAQQNIGVAVADKPTGPFKDPLGKPLVAKADFKRMQVIDPMVFVDDDGLAYLYWGQGRCGAVKLNNDMISFNLADVRDLTPPGYNEGPFVHKRKGKYYLSWSEFDTRDPRYSVAYATGDSPLGPFTKVSNNPILRQSGPVKGAGHHSIVQIPSRDEWVIAYHRFRIPDGNGYNRETCLSPVRHAEDGRILPVDVFESARLKGSAVAAP